MRYLTDEASQEAARFLFLSMAIVVIKQDIQHIENGKFKIKEPYLNLLRTMESEAVTERKNLRKTMEDHRIQVVRLNKNDSFSSFLFLCQGKEEKRNYFNPAIRKKVEGIINELMARALQQYPPSAADANI